MTDLELELEKEKEKVRALYYFTAAYLEKVEQQKIRERIMQIEKSKFFAVLEKLQKQKLAECCILGIKFAETYAKFDAGKKKFFRDEIEDESFKEVRNSLGKVNLSDDHVATLSICAAKDNLKNVCDAMIGKKDVFRDEKKLKDMKKDCMKKVHDALIGYLKGDNKEIGSLLKIGLEHTCKAFADAKTDEEAAEMSRMAEEIMSVVDTNPKLEKEMGLSKNQLKIARKTAELGNDIRRGIFAVQVLISAEQNDSVKLSENQRKDMLQVSFKMKQALVEKQQLAKTWNEPVLVMA